MKPEYFFVFDNNVLVSAFLFRKSTTRQAYDLSINIGQILYCEETLHELWEIMVRPKFDPYLPLHGRIVLLKGFEQISLKSSIDRQVTICRDPKDDMFLGLALSSSADCITSGDKDLLVLSESFEVPILTPAQFLEQYS